MENTEKLIVEQLKNGNEDAYKYIYDCLLYTSDAADEL